MGTLFTLTPGILATTKTVLDDLITELGKDCLLVYPPATVPCTECGGALTHGPHGGPAPNGWVCPGCDNAGTRTVSTTETLRLLLEVNPADWFYRPRPYTQVPANAQVPGGTLKTKCHLAHRPKLLRAQHIIVQPELGPSYTTKYQLDGDPVDVSNITKGYYCVAYWRRAN